MKAVLGLKIWLAAMGILQIFNNSLIANANEPFEVKFSRTCLTAAIPAFLVLVSVLERIAEILKSNQSDISASVSPSSAAHGTNAEV